MRSLSKCEDAINYFAQKDYKFMAIKQYLPDTHEAVKILEEPYTVTKMLQKPKCTMSDFFGSLIIMKEKLSLWSKKVVKKTDLAQKLIEQYEKRKGHLLRNEAMISAVFLDRRYAQMQDDREIALAKLSLCKLWERVRQQKLKFSEITNAYTIVETSNESIHFDDFDIEKNFSSPSKNHSTAIVPTPIEQNLPIPREANFSMSKDEFMIQLSRFGKKYPVVYKS